jgi:cytochrome c biogenesis protein
VYTLDQSQIDSGKLKRVAASKGLKPGEVWTLPDSSRVEFVGTRPWVTLTVRHDPGETFVFAAAVCLLVGLLLSLSGKRRRIWVRYTGGPVGGGSVGGGSVGGGSVGGGSVGGGSVGGGRIEAGGLPRNDYAGFTAEFDDIVRAARKEGAFT